MENTEWKSPDIVIGTVAREQHYYPREEIVADIWENLDKGSSLLFTAPRRVGKTSIMQHIASNPKENYKLVFEDFEGIDSSQKFYAKIYRLLLECLNLSETEKVKKWFQDYCKTKSIIEIDIKGKIKIESLPFDFLKEIDELIAEINKHVSDKVVLLIDELSTMLYNMYKNDKKEDASSVLHNMRRWRQIPTNRNVKFILAGSIGIHYVINVVGQRTDSVNDLVSVPCEPLSADEVSDYIYWATSEATIRYTPALEQYLSRKIQYYVPYFINLMLDEINRAARKSQNPHITEQHIDNAFNAILKSNGNLSDWQQRLEDYMLAEDFRFVNELLMHIAHKDCITIQEIFDKAVKHDKTGNYKSFVNNLVRDGYIAENENTKYVFVSPFLKEFWKRNNPVYTE